MKKFGIFLCFIGVLLLVGGGLIEYGVIDNGAIFGKIWKVNPEFLISDFDDRNLIPFINENGLYGYMDQNGKVVLEAKYVEARKFLYGLAVVIDESGKRYEIDKTGKVIFEIKDGEYGAGFSTSLNGSIVKVNDNLYDTYYNPINNSVETYEDGIFGSVLLRYNKITKKYALVDFTNQVIYESDKKFEVDSFYHQYTFSLYLVVKDGNKITIINDDTKKVIYTIENANEYVFETHDLGFTLIRVDDSTVKSFFIGTNDKVVYEDALSYEVYEGHYIKALNTDGSYTYIDARENKIIKQDEIKLYDGFSFSYSYANLFDVYTCNNSYGLETIIIDGEVVMDCLYGIRPPNRDVLDYLYENHNRKLILFQDGKGIGVYDLVEKKVIKTLLVKDYKDINDILYNSFDSGFIIFTNKQDKTEIYSAFNNTNIVLDGTPEVIDADNHIRVYYEDTNTYQYYNKNLELIYFVTVNK